MTHDEIRATLTLCLLASFADGEKHDREREQIRQVAEGLAGDEAVNLPGLYQDVLLRRVKLEDVLARLSGTESRQLAYEMAVCVCDADGQTSAKEEAFLAQVRQAWGMGGTAPASGAAAAGAGAASAAAAGASTAAMGTEWGRATDSFDAQARTVADAPLQTPVPEAPLPQGALVPHPAAVDELATTAAQRRPGTLSAAEMDSKILKSSIMNGAIELLPENLSTLAIIPLQMRLVYQIGQSYGYELDRGHIKDLLGALGVGLTSQYLEEAGRKLLGGLLGRAGKGLLGGLGRQAVSSGMSFASTYALGHVANQYYAGGRTLSTAMLKDAYQHVMKDGRELQSRYLPQMQETARGLNTAKIMAMVRGS
ncbi:TerB family tellurite resistance protein [Comamonas endophytica]|uniref:TerB family tellurite resistance protein n=1 Tax=Comamonas endophytica TaxID=2949090 RepID=A0ABY6GAE1_9BURK|nr:MULTISPECIES: TerB family tellurite resistance protein [unclassified Acidovorax]MCD2514213.1 TerB family tellurite resistance protein [Acidovorax sp. D4N7]UYG51352.1 TerB family tellurite resistance protein [Acidovorax sp. 5MLIR]